MYNSRGLRRSFPPLCLFNGSVLFQRLHNFVHEFLYHQSPKIYSPLELLSLNFITGDMSQLAQPRDNVSTGATVTRICKRKRNTNRIPVLPSTPPPLFFPSVVRRLVKVCVWLHRESNWIETWPLRVVSHPWCIRHLHSTVVHPSEVIYRVDGHAVFNTTVEITT